MKFFGKNAAKASEKPNRHRLNPYNVERNEVLESGAEFIHCQGKYVYAILHNGDIFLTEDKKDHNCLLRFTVHGLELRSGDKFYFRDLGDLIRDAKKLYSLFKKHQKVASK